VGFYRIVNCSRGLVSSVAWVAPWLVLAAGCDGEARQGAFGHAGLASGVPGEGILEGETIEAPPALGRHAALRTREGNSPRLMQLARQVGVGRVATAQLSAVQLSTVQLAVSATSAPNAVELESAVDAGVGGASLLAADAGGSIADAGAEPDAAPPPVAPPELLPPEPLPRDIVAQSALPIYGLEAGAVLSESALWDRLSSSPAVCFGEFHDVPAHHYAEARALDELASRAASCGHSLAVGFEMFQRPFQAGLSAFVAGEIGEDAFLEQTEYVQRWGYDFSLYRPLLEGVRAHHLPALALNARAELTRKIGRTGLVSLDEVELAELPALVLDDAEHRDFIFGLFGVLPEHAAEFGLENVYAAQTVWDETMADTSARWLASAGSSARLLDFAGGAHCHVSAIPRRITRRTGEPALSVHAVFASELADGSFTPEGYDVLVVLDDTVAP
jgi:uncharacterized iron-regulated protein